MQIIRSCAASLGLALAGLVVGPLAALALGPLAGSLVAQEYAVARESYAFYSDRVDVEVLATSAGRLQIIRGGLGRLEVAGRAADGLAAFGLSDQPSVLRLTALGASGADYVVVVPERTAVSVRLPGRRSFEPSTRYGAKTYQWHATADTLPQAFSNWPKPGMDGRFFVVAARHEPPQSVRIVRPEMVASVEVRMEGAEFQIGSNRPFAQRAGASSVIDLDPGRDTVDLLIRLPAYTRDFTLTFGALKAVQVVNGVLVDLCGPALRQTVAGVSRVTLRPADGVQCGVQKP